MLDHPSNPGFPTYWHARGYGLFAANPMGEKVFTDGKKELNVAIEPGASIVFRHRIVILSGQATRRRGRTAVPRLHRFLIQHASRHHRRRQHQRHPRARGTGDRGLSVDAVYGANAARSAALAAEVGATAYDDFDGSWRTAWIW